jgi:hypothetical protein
LERASGFFAGLGSALWISIVTLAASAALTRLFAAGTASHCRSVRDKDQHQGSSERDRGDSGRRPQAWL